MIINLNDETISDRMTNIYFDLKKKQKLNIYSIDEC